MKKRILSGVIAVTLSFSVIAAAPVTATAQTAGGSLDHFTPKNTYISGQFTDVNTAAWYSMYIQADVEYGLLSGKPAGVFAPGDMLTAAEAVKIVDCLHSVYYTGKTAVSTSTAAPWYKPYADYALKNGIIDAPFSDYTAPITRAQFAEMISKALPLSAFPTVNVIEDNAIPDVSMTDSFAGPVYTLYRAGIFNGNDDFGTFRPFDALSRAEAAAVTARTADKEFRSSLTLPSVLNSEDIYRKCADAVFYLERYDTDGELIGIGSGFFITRDGLAVTNYHVIDGAASAVITTADGQTYDVKGVVGYQKSTDLALLQIDGSGFSYLQLADSDNLEIGTGVYTIGSPFGIINTLSTGIVSSAVRKVDGKAYIQYSAPISMGSGGGPVLNSLGQVIGVTCLTMRNGQTLNLAVPSNAIGEIPRIESTPLIILFSKNGQTIWYYKNFYPVPDYGSYTDTPLYRMQQDLTTGVQTYYYDRSAIGVSNDIAVDGYIKTLAQVGFVWQSSSTNEAGYTVDVYYNADYDMNVLFGLCNFDGIVCRFVAIH